MDNFLMEYTILEIYDQLNKNNFSTLQRPERPMWDRPLIGFARGDDPILIF